MKLSEIASRLDGVSTPFFGVSWTPATSDVAVARGVLRYLQGRRLLYDRHEITAPYADARRRIEQSVLEIRAFLTDVLVQGGASPELEASLNSMRVACMHFLDALDRYSDFVSATQGSPWTGEHDEAAEDRVANAVLFRESLQKLMVEVGDAFDLPVPEMG